MTIEPLSAEECHIGALELGAEPSDGSYTCAGPCDAEIPAGAPIYWRTTGTDAYCTACARLHAHLEGAYADAVAEELEMTGAEA